MTELAQRILERRAIVTKAANYHARAGETIVGNLKRGADGRFGSGGSSTPKTGAELAYQQGRASAAPKALRGPIKPKKGGKAKKSPKPKPTDEEKQAAKDKKKADTQTQNRAAVFAKVSVNEQAQSQLSDLMAGNQPQGDASGLVDFGLVEQGEDGSYRLTSSGRTFMNAANRGDVAGAQTALGSSKDRQFQRQERLADRQAAKAQADAKRKARQKAIDDRRKAQAKARATKEGSAKITQPALAAPPKTAEQKLDESKAAQTKAALATAKQVDLPDQEVDNLQMLAGDKPTPDNVTIDRSKLIELGFADENGVTKAGITALTALKRGNTVQYMQAVKAGKEAAAKKAAADAELTTKSILVTKAVNGSYRWVMTSATAHQDKDGETIRKSALVRDCARADKDKDYGPLLWWHTKARLGTCDFNMVEGPCLIESGTFINDHVARTMQNFSPFLGGSLGFHALPWEPDQDKSYSIIRRRERSFLPQTYAAGRLTAVTVHKEMKMSEEEERQLKFKQLATMLGISENEVQKMVEKEAKRVTTAAAAAQLVEKAGQIPPKSDPNAPPADDPTAVEGSPEEEMTESPKEAAAEGDDLETSGSLFQESELKEMAAAMAPIISQMTAAEVIRQMGPLLDMEKRIQTLLQQLQSTASTATGAVVTKETDPKIADLEKKLELVTKELTELKGDRPSGDQYQPSVHGDTFLGRALNDILKKKESTQGTPGGETKNTLDQAVDFLFSPEKTH